MNLFALRVTSATLCALVLQLAPLPAALQTTRSSGDSTPISATGTLQPTLRLDVKPQTSGVLKEVLVQEGQWVEPGTPLMTIDPAFAQLKMKEVEAQLAMDQAGLSTAQKKWGRFKRLAEKNLVSEMEWDEVEAQVSRAKASVDLAQARLSLAKMEVDRCHLKAPIAGRIGRIDALPGQLVSSGQTLATIANMDSLVVEFSIPEQDAQRLPRDLERTTISVGCSAGSCTAGHVTFVDNQFDPKTGLLLLRGRVANQEHRLRPGQRVQVSLPTE